MDSKLVLIYLLGIFILLNNNDLNAQEVYTYGYVITNQFDTIYGQVKDTKGFPLKKYKKIRFINNKGKHRKLGTSDIRGYGLGNHQYETKWYDGKERFLRKRITGFISFYEYEYVISSEDGTYIESNKLLYRFGDHSYFEVDFFRFRKNMMVYMADNPEIVIKLKNRDYRYRDLYELVYDYNKSMLANRAIMKK